MILDTLINTTIFLDQHTPSITALTDGGFVITWMSTDSDGSLNYDIYGQRYDASGNKQDVEFRVNSYTTSNQNSTSVVALADGGFVVTWSSFDVVGNNGHDIYGQRYDADGNTQGTEFLVNTYTTNNQQYPSVTALTDGGFVVTWSSKGQDGSGEGVYGQRYDFNGAQQGLEFRANTPIFSDQFLPSSAGLTDGGFVVTWSSGDYSLGYDIYGQRYDVNGNPQGIEFRTNTYTTDSQHSPSVAALPDGGFVVTWTSGGQDNVDYNNGVYGQRYDASGNKQDVEFRVNSYTAGNESESSITALTDGGFVVTWQSYAQDGSGWGIYGQRYDFSGDPQGAEILINTYTSDNQSNVSVIGLKDGGFVVTWDSSDQDGSGLGIYGKRYDASGNAVEWIINHTPTLITPLVDQSVTYDTSDLSYDASTSFSDEDIAESLSYSATLANGDGLPAWIHIDTTSGLITGNPVLDDLGIYALNITATDLRGSSINAPLNIEVTAFSAGHLLVSTNGADILGGTAGNDTVTYAYAVGPVTVSLATSSPQDTGGAGLDTLTNIDNLIGSKSNDILIGNIDNNFLDGGSGIDTLTGGTGNDTYIVDDAADIITEDTSAGTDSVWSLVSYILPANVENISLLGDGDLNATGNSKTNTLNGNSGDNILDGKAGADTMIGEAGDDTYYVDNASDIITENVNEGIDTVQSSVDYTLSANVENLTLIPAASTTFISAIGNELLNNLVGNNGRNTLKGMGGNDILNGNNGNDILIGGLGADQLIGGGGADKFRFENISDSGTGSGNRDIVLDFSRSQSDKINLSVIDAKSSTLKNDAFIWTGTATFTHREGELHYFVESGNTIVEGDINADGVADFQIQFTGIISLIKTDFVL